MDVARFGSLKDWIPSLPEVGVFVIIIVIFIVWVLLIHYSVINNIVNNSSRCLKERTKYKQGAVYQVAAYDKFNNPLYNVSYDLNNKAYTHSCACNPGNFTNEFSVDVYDLLSNKAGNVKKLCSCDQSFQTTSPTFNTYFNGFPGLIDFMNNPKNTTFFTNSLNQL